MASYYNDIRFGYYSGGDSYAFSVRCLKELTVAEKAAKEKALAKAKADSIAKAKTDSIAKAAADALAKVKIDSIAKAKAAAREAAKPMYCAIYIEGKLSNCINMKDVEDDRLDCGRKNMVFQMSKTNAQARWAASCGNEPAKAPAAPANNSSKPMYCVIYMGGKLTACTELRDTQEGKANCDMQNNGLKMMGGKAQWTDAKPNISCGK